MFKREKRYFVFKITDLPAKAIPSFVLSERGINLLREMKGKPPLQPLVIEADWPEYESAWEAIKRRMEGQQTIEQELRGTVEKLEDDLLYVNLQPCPQCVAAESAIEKLRNAVQRMLDSPALIQEIANEVLPPPLNPYPLTCTCASAYIPCRLHTA